MYHRIGTQAFDPWGLCVSIEAFRRQVEWLKKTRSILPLAELARKQANGGLPTDAVAITFDDGYASVAQSAVPLLAQMGVPATIFISPDLTERGREFWWDELQHIVTERAGESLSFLGEELTLRTRPERHDAFLRIWASVREKGLVKVEAALADLRAQAGGYAQPRETHRPMTIAEARSIVSPLITFGSHTLSHAWLPGLSTAEKRDEIKRSARRCEAIVGERPTAFAYPFGGCDARSEELVEEAGYSCACTTGEKPITAETGRFVLPRVAVGNWSPAQLRRALARL